MRDYLNFVWDSLMHPHSIMDVLPAFQILLFIIFWYFYIRAIISLIQHNKEQKHGKK